MTQHTLLYDNDMHAHIEREIVHQIDKHDIAREMLSLVKIAVANGSRDCWQLYELTQAVLLCLSHFRGFTVKPGGDMYTLCISLHCRLHSLPESN